VLHRGCVCFLKTGFQEIIFQIFMCLFVIRKVGRRKTLSGQRKIWLGFQESIFLLFWRKTLSENYEKFRNVILFVDYIKFGPQTFDCYIYILFWIFVFQFHPLEFNFYINFGPYFYNYYLLFPYHFLIEIFYLSNFFLILLIVTYFIWNNLWYVNYYYFNFFIFQFFYFLDLISIILIIIYFIWENLWNYIFFQFHSHSTF
jgi:hypothetical protein